MAGTVRRIKDFLRRTYIAEFERKGGLVHCIPKLETELHLEVVLADHCDLNCVGCDHFSPLAEPEFADCEEVARDLARLSSLFHGQAQEICLMGGEPLLHPDLIKFFKIARENFPDAHIFIVTNGVRLLNQPEEFWLACKEHNIGIEPTKYPIPLKFEEMEKRAAQYGVEYVYYNRNILKKMNLFRLDPEGRQNSRWSFLLCSRANHCVNLRHGRLYTCPVPPMARHFNKHFGKDLKDVPENSIDIYQANSSREILDFLARPIPFCRYCMMDQIKWNQPWRKSKREIGEWT